MKKAIINYSKSIRYKILNDQMTRREAGALCIILIVSLVIVLHLCGVKLNQR
jgi:hypothetical protein